MIPANAAFQQGQGAVSADNLNTFTQTCATAAQLRAFVGLPGMQVDLQGLFAPNDGQGGAFLWNASVTGDNGSTVIIPNGNTQGGWIRLSYYTSSNLIVNVKAFGAAGDGVTDDTAAIEAAEASLVPGQALWFPSGTYVFTSALSSIRPRFCWLGAGFGQSILMYKGASTTIDIFTLGDNITEVQNAYMDGLTIQSTTVMTAGAAAHIKAVGRSVINLQIMGQDGFQTLGNNFWNGIWFDQASYINWSGLQCEAQNEGVMVNGGPLGADNLLIADGSKIAECRIGIHMGGGFGGLFIGTVNLEINYNHIKVDQALYAVGNRELFCNGTAPDVTTGGPGIWLADPGGPTCQFTGIWCSGSTGIAGFYIDPAQNSGFTIISGGQIFDNLNDGLRVDAAGAIVSIFGTEFIANGGWAINPNVVGNHVNWSGVLFSGNGSGTYRPTYPSAGGYPDLGYQATINTLEVLPGGAIELDSTFYLTFQASQPIINFAANSYLQYNRTPNTYSFVANGAVSFTAGSGYVATPPLTVSTLPAAATAGAGARAFVTDANSTTFNAAAVGGGTNRVPVWSNGSGWFVG